MKELARPMDIQKQIDTIVVLLLTIRATQKLSVLEASMMDSAIRDLQDISRILPTLNNRDSIIHLATKALLRALVLFKTNS